MVSATATEVELVTVVIPARNEATAIAACLDSVLEQTYSNLQVVVVVGASEDGTLEIVQGYAARDPRVEVLQNPDAIIPRSLNLALKAARGAWLVRVDAHCTIPSDYVQRCVAHLATGRWGGVGGRKEGVGLTPAGQAIAASMASRFGQGDSLYHYGTEAQTVDHVPFGAYPTALIRTLGGWDDRLLTNEDAELDYRVRKEGHELFFDPDIRIRWQCRQSIPELFRQYLRYGSGRAATVFLHPRSIALRHLAPPALVAALLAAIALPAHRRRAPSTLVASYAIALTVGTASTARGLSWAARPRVPAAFAAMHLGWGLGFWGGIARNLKGRVVAGAEAMPQRGQLRP